MKQAGFYQWKPVTPDGTVLWLKYWWGPASANSLAYKRPDGKWVVVSPASGAPQSVYERLDESGTVAALIAPNAFHNLGQRDWKSRFPKARSYAPEGAIARLRTKSPEISYMVLENAVEEVRPAQLFIPDGMKTPDALLLIPAPSGPIWWVGDQFSNNAKEDQILPLRIISRIIARGPGFGINPNPTLVYVRDKSLWFRTMQSKLSSNLPSVIICAHGDPIFAEAAKRTKEAFATIESRML
jgi:hypothetical protein